ncbi:30S ribosomal protein S17 [candidate division WWE3 bacterium RIFCSPHIGHO2_01_FULL_42_13]|uniref:Small ribosomal subunit protein uS17 n=1 Tax=candidate division WWE3 bacterium RIFCSPHIGHO2_01_FULL_42_13 TaxID=1802617 RepID=A0A1F4UR36_UNCKA|nr:MAG: 30S ribosomal protein S17 [candidate division WWE3 bacterium RIFCSPHIGHO2_01_FULL_42_13]
MPKKVLTGHVVSAKMQKTVVVAVDMSRKHPIYDKIVKNTRRFKARDEIGTKEGDFVRIEESKPLSKTVNWRVLEVLEVAKEEN